MSFGMITSSDLKRIWRIVAAIVVCQLLGSAIGLVIAPHHSAFSNMWLGGAIASPIGFVLGLGWQLLDLERRGKTPVPTTGFLGILAIGVAASACFGVLPHMQAEMQYLQALKTLDGS